MVKRKNSKGIGGHQSAVMQTVEWFTPPEIVKALGPFDLDPCSPINRPWDTAKTHYTIEGDGLCQSWSGRVWLNPPYGMEAAKWLDKLMQHGNGIALIFARTETAMFQKYVWENADAVFFFYGRIFFHHLDGTRAKANAGAPSCLIIYGKNNITAVEKSGLNGKIIYLK